jgi:ABC-2 type transport system ATP-binding protein
LEKTIQFVNVSKTFIRRTFKDTLLRRPVVPVNALEDISMSISKGQVFGLLGSNGAGKTTLVKLAAGLITADSGYIELFGQPVNEGNIEMFLSHVGLVTANERSFYWRLSGRQNLEFFGKMYDLPSKTRNTKINHLVEQLELKDFADRPFMTYSTGQKQRFAIARSLLNDPGVLLFDEATSALDPVAGKKLLTFIKDVLVKKHQKTIIWCTHNLAEAEKICDSMAILHKGRIIAQGTLDEMQAKVSKTAEYLIISRKWKDSLQTNLSIRPETVEEKNNGITELVFKCLKDELPIVLKDLIAQQVEVYDCSRKNLQLEEVFEKEILLRR